MPHQFVRIYLYKVVVTLLLLKIFILNRQNYGYLKM